MNGRAALCVSNGGTAGVLHKTRASGRKIKGETYVNDLFKLVKE